jgi:hypothetical protein
VLQLSPGGAINTAGLGRAQLSEVSVVRFWGTSNESRRRQTAEKKIARPGMHSPFRAESIDVRQSVVWP